MSERIRRGIVIPTTDHVSATAIVIIAMTTLLSLKRTVSITGLRWFGPAQVVRCTAETIATLTQIVSFDTSNSELPYVFHPTEERLGVSERTCATQPAMSAVGHKRTCAAQSVMSALPNSDHESGHPQKVMSALPPKADVCGALAHVCFGPKADIAIYLITSSANRSNPGPRGGKRPGANGARST